MAAEKPEIINITDVLRHPAVYKDRPSGSRTTYKEWCEANPASFFWTDRYSGKVCSYTNEKHRRMWGCMVKLSFDVRSSNMTLTKETFQDDNLVVVDGCYLRFLKLEAHESNDTNEDFTAIAEKIESIVADQVSSLPEVVILIRALKTYDPTARNARNTRAFLLCNYATMRTEMRKEFLMSLSHRLYKGNYGYDNKLSNICRDYEKSNDWRSAVSIDEYNPLYKVFWHREYDEKYPLCLMEFVRNGLHHLSDTGYYRPEHTWFTMNCYFSKFMSKVQYKLYLCGAWTAAEMFSFQPITF